MTIDEGELATSVAEKKAITKTIYLYDARKGKLLN